MPDIPIRGELLSRVGQGLQRLSGVLAGMADANNAAAADIIRAQSSYEFNMAKSAALSQISQWNATMSGDPDDSTYLSRWDEFSSKITDQTSQIITLPGARQQFDTWWVQAGGEQRASVITKAQGRFEERVKGGFLVLMENYRNLGDVINLRKVAQEAVEEAGAFTWKELEAWRLLDAIKVASGNRARNALRGEEIEAALDIAFNPSFGSRYELTPEQVKQIQDELEARQGYELDKAEQQVTAGEQQAFQDWGKWATAAQKGEVVYDPYQALFFEQSVPDSKRPLVTGFHALLEEDQAKTTEKIQEGNFNRWIQAAYAWDGTPESQPFDDAQLRAAVASGDLSEARFNTITEVLKEVSTKTTSATGANMASRMYSGLENGSDPRLMVLPRDIESAVREGRIEAEEGERLRSLRIRLGTDWETTRPKAMATTIDGEMAALEIVNDMSRTPDERREAIFALRGKGLSPADTDTWVEKVDEWQGQRGQLLGTLKDFYRIAMQAPDLNTAQRRELQAEQLRAYKSLERVILDNPDDPAIWESTLNNTLSKTSAQAVEALIEQRLGGVFRGTLFGEAQRANVLEAANELGILQQFPSDAAAYASYAGRIESNEKASLQRVAGVSNVSETRVDSNTRNRLYRSGSTWYQVWVENVNGTNRRVVYRLNPTPAPGTWEPVGTDERS